MTVLHSGSTMKFAAGWESIFDKSAAKKTAAGKRKSPVAGKPAVASGAKVKKKAAGADKKPSGRKKSKRA